MVVGEPPGVHVEVCGQLTAHTVAGALCGADLGSRKARQVLLLLAGEEHRTMPVDGIVDALWGSAPPDHARRVVASLVSRLRSTLGREVIVGNAEGYRLAAAVTVDLDEARALVAEARSRLDETAPGLAVAAGERALRLLASPPLDDTDSGGVRAEHARLQRQARLVVGTALVDVDRPESAVPLASDALATDPLDEEAARLSMVAHSAAANPGAALRTYESLRRSLRQALGSDPSPASAALHAALLHGDTLIAPRSDGPSRGAARRSTTVDPALAPSAGLPFAGRVGELGLLERHWSDAARGLGGLVLIAGEAGVGKTRLATQVADLAHRTGGLVLEARCFEAERSLLIQPISEALGVAVARLSPDVVGRASAGHEDELVRIVPTLPAAPAAARRGNASEHTSERLDERPTDHRTVEVERQRTFEAVGAFVAALARIQPVLLSLDDLQNASSLTIEAIHYLRRVMATAPLLVVATVRPTEGAAALRLLSPVAERIDLGPLEPDAVAELASAAGHGERAGEIRQRTGGHALFVVEILRDLASGGNGRPDTLQTAVLGRLAQCGPTVGAVLRAGSVLGSAFDPLLAASIAGETPAAALGACETALAARLLAVRGSHYEFANDLIRDAVYAAQPEPSRIAQHRLAADLLVDQPEVVAGHALAAGEIRRACLSWLLAAEDALRRFAANDAEFLADQALSAATHLDDRELRGRALLARGHGRDAQSAHGASHADFADAALEARSAGDLRLEMAALRATSGDVTITVADTTAGIEDPLQRILEIARSLGDGSAEADALGRLAILSSARLDFVQGAQFVSHAERVAASSGDPLATVHAIDARKNLLAYQGIVGELAAVTNRLGRMQRASGDLWSLQWTVFESSFPPLAAEDYDAAHSIMLEALEINRRSGFVASESWYVAHLGWLHRLRGDLARALALGADAVELARRHGRHRWWLSAAASLYAASLLADGRPEAAAALLTPLRPTGPPVGDEGYRLRVLAPLAEASRAEADLRAADTLMAGLRTDQGNAWLLGADAYLSLARAWLAHGNRHRAEDVLAPFIDAAAANGWPAFVRQATSALQRSCNGAEESGGDGIRRGGRTTPEESQTWHSTWTS